MSHDVTQSVQCVILLSDKHLLGHFSISQYTGTQDGLPTRQKPSCPSKNNHRPSLIFLHHHPSPNWLASHAPQAPKRRRRRHRKTHLGYDGQISQTKENDWPGRHQLNHNAIVSSHIHLWPSQQDQIVSQSPHSQPVQPAEGRLQGPSAFLQRCALHDVGAPLQHLALVLHHAHQVVEVVVQQLLVLGRQAAL